MVKVLNYDRKGRLIEDMSKVAIRLDEFPQIVREAQRIATDVARKKEGTTA